MSSAEIISRVQELTTPASGDTNFVFGLVIPAMKGSIEPQLITGITQLKQEYTPTGKFDMNTHTALYSAKKYFDAGSGQLWAVRVDTNAKLSAVQITSNHEVFGSSYGVLPEGLEARIGYSFGYNNHIYVVKTQGTFPDFTSMDSWVAENCDDIGAVGTSSWKSITVDTFGEDVPPPHLTKGLQYKLLEVPNIPSITNIHFELYENETYPLFFAMDSHKGEDTEYNYFGWFQNSPEEELNFGYFHKTGSSFTLDEAVELSTSTPWTCTRSIFTEDRTFINSANCYPVDFSDTWILEACIDFTQAEVLATESFRTILEGDVVQVSDLIQINNVAYCCISEFSSPYNSDTKKSSISYAWMKSHLVPIAIPWWNVIGQVEWGGFLEESPTSSSIGWAPNALFCLYAKNGGSWGDENSVTIDTYEEYPDEIEIPDAFRINHYYRGSFVKSYICCLNYKNFDANGNNLFIEDVINRSDYIGAIVRDEEQNKSSRAISESYPTGSYSGQEAYRHFLGGHDNGSVFNFKSQAWIQALEKLKDATKYPIVLMGNGGYHSNEIPDVMNNWVTDRQIGIVSYSLPQMSPTEMGELVDSMTSISNERFWWESFWSSEYDADTGRTVNIPPDGLMAYTYAKMIQDVGYYEAPAGWINAPVTTKPLEEYDKGTRDYLENKKINFFKTSSLGTCIFSEVTSLKRPSYLQQKHIVVALYDLIPQVENALEPFLYSLGEDGVYLRMRKAVEPIMEIFMANKGCATDPAPAVTCDSSNNTQTTKDAQEANIWIEYTPLNSIKRIRVTFALTNGSVRLADVAEV